MGGVLAATSAGPCRCRTCGRNARIQARKPRHRGIGRAAPKKIPARHGPRRRLTHRYLARSAACRSMVAAKKPPVRPMVIVLGARVFPHSITETVRRRLFADLAAPGLDRPAARLALQALLDRAARRSRRPALLGHDRNAVYQFLQAPQCLGAVLFQAAIFLRLDDDDAVLADALVSQAEQARAQGSGSADAPMSKRRCTALETLLTFWPPAPWARMALNSTSWGRCDGGWA